ncbi:MAG: hypothetical protein EON58_10470 [Alphaproteobacteria bacterium]|nr:MAG: hypothetical protein EON58_10470 [Alphaproteobacteria bacterium]
MNRILCILPFLFVCSCITPAMREVTARNNGAKFWLWTVSSSISRMEYEGPVDPQNRANGLGTYVLRDDYYGGNHFEGSGFFKNGRPDGEHSFRVPSPLMEGFHHYSNGLYTGTTKTRNDMPSHIVGSVLGGLTAHRAAQKTSGSPAASQSKTSANDGPWYPVHYNYRNGTLIITVGGVKLEDGDSVLLKPGAGHGWGRIVPGGGG